MDIKEPVLMDFFRKVENENFLEVQPEKGWRIILDGIWMCKRSMPGTPKRVYASYNAAKTICEQEFRGSFSRMWHKLNQKEYDSCYHYVPRNYYHEERQSYECKDFEKVEKLDNARNRCFRKFMNSLFEIRKIRIEEVK